MIDKRSDRQKHLLIQLCYWYYVKGEPLVSDKTYDGLFDELKNMEKAFGPDKDSPTQIIWGDREDQYPAWAKEKELITIKYDLKDWISLMKVNND